MSSLWRLRGAKEKQRIVDWFYEAQAKSNRTSREPDGMRNFLQSVHETGRPDTQDLVAALVADRRLDDTPRLVVIPLLEIASEGLPEPLVNVQEIYSGDGHTKQALARWRDILRRHCNGISEPSSLK